MKQLISMPRSVPCSNCTGRTTLEFDRVDVGLGGGRLLHFMSVPYYQCGECDHRQMHEQTQERLDEGIEPFLIEIGSSDSELVLFLQWREVISLGFDDDSEMSDRIFEVEWTLG